MKKIFLVTLVVLLILPSVIMSAKLPEVIEGYFVSSKGARVVLKDYEGKTYNIGSDKETKLYIDTRPVFSYKTFKKGMEVYAVIKNNKLFSLEGYSSENPGYEVPDSIHRTGVITGIDRELLRIRWANGKETEVQFTSGTIFRKNRKLTKPENIVVGDRVRATFPDSLTDVASIIRVMGESIKIRGIYSGTLANVDAYEDKITLTNLRVYENGSFKKVDQWDEDRVVLHSDRLKVGTDDKSKEEKEKERAEKRAKNRAKNRADNRIVSYTDKWEDSEIGDGLEIKFSDKTPIYLGGVEVPKNKLKLYKNKEAYIAVRDDFGRPIAERVILKSQNEVSYSTKISEINEMASIIELKNKQNVAVNDGTIIIDQDRIVDFSNLREGSSALIVSDGKRADKSASIVLVHNRDINVSNISDYKVFRGRLQTISPEEVILKDYFVLNNHRWESFAEEKTLYFDDEVKLMNFEVGIGGETPSPGGSGDILQPRYDLVSVKEFVEGYFSVDEDVRRRTNLPKDKINPNVGHGRDWYGQFFMEGDRITGGIVSKSIDSLNRQRAVIAEIKTAPEFDAKLGWKIVVKNAKEYSYVSEEWVERYSDLTFYLKYALVVRDGEPVNISVIEPGDKVYFMRDQRDLNDLRELKELYDHNVISFMLVY